MQALYLCFAILVFAPAAAAGDTSLEPVKTQPSIIELSKAPRYWSASNIVLVTADAVAKSGDEWFTMRNAGSPNFHENNPLARPFVTHGRLIAGASQGLLFAAEVFTSYQLNKHHHAKMAKMLLLFGIAGNVTGIATSTH